MGTLTFRGCWLLGHCKSLSLCSISWSGSEARLEQTYLLFFCKIHSNAVYHDKDKCLTLETGLGSKLYRQIVGIPMGTSCAPLVADLFLFCYERDFMLSLSQDNQSGVIEAFNSTSRYLDDLLNIDNNFFDSMVNRIYPSELQLNKTSFWIYIDLYRMVL